MRFRFALLGILGLAMSAGAADSPAAEGLDEVRRLHQAGQSEAALHSIDAALATQPRDAPMRFMKAVILGDAGRDADAVAVLEKMVEDFPDLAEPYNNLAVFYAKAGDPAKARASLEQALQLNPGYATAHENLGGVYAALAARSYATAARLDPGRAGIAAKLALLRQLATPATAIDPAAAPATPRSR